MPGFLRPKWNDLCWWRDIIPVTFIAALSLWFAEFPFFSKSGFCALTLAIVTGMVIANTIFPKLVMHTHTGVDYAKNVLLCAGIILYGFRITFQQIMQVGWTEHYN